MSTAAHTCREEEREGDSPSAAETDVLIRQVRQLNPFVLRLVRIFLGIFLG